MAEDPSNDPALLAGLRKAVAGPHPLQDKDKATKGLFPKTAAGKELAKLATDRGWIEELSKVESVTTTSKTGKVKTTQKNVSLGWKITGKGLNHLAAADSPKGALESLVPLVQKLDPQGSSPDAGAFRKEVDRATEACMGLLREAFRGLQADVMKALAPAPGAGVDASSVLGALKTALGKVEPVTRSPSG